METNESVALQEEWRHGLEFYVAMECWESSTLLCKQDIWEFVEVNTLEIPQVLPHRFLLEIRS